MGLHQASPRQMLRKLRELLAGAFEPQTKLDNIVNLIATNMVAEVCSIYILRADRNLELFATQGLNPQAVHNTQLRLGEGLVGTIAEEAKVLNLTDARQHPSFSYKPETNEDDYQAFLGVPLLRSGQVLGVLVVQNISDRSYGEEEEEALQTTATVLSEMLSTAEFQELFKSGDDLDLRKPRHFRSHSLSPGIGVGKAVLHDPRVTVSNFISDDEELENQRLDEALDRLRSHVDNILSGGSSMISGEYREIMEAYRMFAYDQGWVRKIREAISTGLTAEAAVERVQNDTRARMLRQTDPYIRERLHDLDDLANRLLREIIGSSLSFETDELPDQAIIVARNMGPAELLDYQGARISALVFEEGGALSHVAIVARSLGIPAVGQVENATSITENGDMIIVDGQSGDVYIRPSPEVELEFQTKAEMLAEKLRSYEKLSDLPSVTRDGTEIFIYINAGISHDLGYLHQMNATGVGLFRTELQFMIASKLPSLNEQIALYEQIFEAAKGKPVTFRILDIGGDKVVPYIRVMPEENPAMGWRALRLGLDRTGLIRTQMRALLHSAVGKDLKILIPMVTDVSEYKATQQSLDRELKRLDKMGREKPKSISMGAMIEVPSILFELDQLLPLTDFISVGSNDLLQFLTASDRGNPRVANRYDPLASSRLKALRSIVESANKHNKPLTMCGELASSNIEAMALMAIGYRHLSVSAMSIGPLKELILSVNLEELKPRLNAMVDQGADGMSIRALLTDYIDNSGL